MQSNYAQKSHYSDAKEYSWCNSKLIDEYCSNGDFDFITGKH
jgi:hypothetical protein